MSGGEERIEERSRSNAGVGATITRSPAGISTRPFALMKENLGRELDPQGLASYNRLMISV